MKKANLYMLLGIATIGSLHAMEKHKTPTEITSPNYNFTAPDWVDSENQHHLFKNVVLTRKYISDNSKPGIDNEPAIDLEILNKYHYRQEDYFENVINAYKCNVSDTNNSEFIQKIVERHQKARPFETALSRTSQELHSQLIAYMAYGRDPAQEESPLAQSFYIARGEFNKACFDILDFIKKIRNGSDGKKSGAGDSLGDHITPQNLNFNYNFVTNGSQETIEQQRRAEEESRKQYEQYQRGLTADLLRSAYTVSSSGSDNSILEQIKKIDLGYLRHFLKSPDFPLSHLKDSLVRNELEKSITYLNRECGTNIQLPQKQQAYRPNFNFS